MTVIAIILAGSAPLQFSSPRDLVVNMRQPHFARVRARRNCATNPGRGLNQESFIEKKLLVAYFVAITGEFAGFLSGCSTTVRGRSFDVPWRINQLSSAMTS